MRLGVLVVNESSVHQKTKGPIRGLRFKFGCLCTEVRVSSTYLTSGVQR